LIYYFAKNGFVYPLGEFESKKPLSVSKNYLYLSDEIRDVKFFISDKKLEAVKSKSNNADLGIKNIEFVTIKSAEKFDGDFGEPAGDDVKKVSLDGFYFEYHKGQYEKKYLKNLMKECINEGVKTQVQIYCCMVKKLHPED